MQREPCQTMLVKRTKKSITYAALKKNHEFAEKTEGSPKQIFQS